MHADRSRILSLRFVPPELAGGDPPLRARCAIAVVRGLEGDLAARLLREARSIGAEARTSEAAEGEILAAAWSTKLGAGSLERAVRRAVAPFTPSFARTRATPARGEDLLLYRALRGDLQNADFARGLLRAAASRVRERGLGLAVWRAWLDVDRADAFLRERLEALGGSASPDLGGARSYGALTGATVSRLGGRLFRVTARGVLRLAVECYTIRMEIYRERGESRTADRFAALAEAAKLHAAALER